MSVRQNHASNRPSAEPGADQTRPVEVDAWIGLLETHKRLTRVVDAELESKHGLTLSSVELLGRLAASPQCRLRLSALAEQTGLSLSRVSRIVDALERRGLVRRRACRTDARAVEAHLTDAGYELSRQAQAAHLACVQREFFARLAADEVETLSLVFGRFAPRAAATCTTAVDGG